MGNRNESSHSIPPLLLVVDKMYEIEVDTKTNTIKCRRRVIKLSHIIYRE